MIRDHILFLCGKPPLIWCKAGTLESWGKWEINGFLSKRDGRRGVRHCWQAAAARGSRGSPLGGPQKSSHISSESPVSVQLNPKGIFRLGYFWNSKIMASPKSVTEQAEQRFSFSDLARFWTSLPHKLGAVALWQGREAVTQGQNRYLDMIFLSRSSC